MNTGMIYSQYRHYIGEAVEACEVWMVKFVGQLQLPRHMKRYVGGMCPYGECGSDVAAERVAHHEQPFGRNAQMLAECAVVCRGFVAYNLHMAEEGGEAGALQFVVLVKQLALSEKSEPIAVHVSDGT